MASLSLKLRTIIGSLLQIGIGGPNLKANGAALESRNSADSGYVVMRGAPAVADNDFITKQQLDTSVVGVLPVSAQFNGGSAIPANTGTEKWSVVTTTGVNASIGQILWDDGSGSGSQQVLAASTGRLIVTTAAFSGGTITFTANTLYTWNGSAWVLSSGATTTGQGQWIRFNATNTATADSVTSQPAGASALSCRLTVTTPYSGGATLQVILPGAATGPADMILMDTTDINPQDTTGTAFLVFLDSTKISAFSSVCRVVVGGAPAAGACTVEFEYSSANP